MAEAKLNGLNRAVADSRPGRIAEPEREGWLGEAEGLQISLAGANKKLTQIDHRSATPRSTLESHPHQYNMPAQTQIISSENAQAGPAHRSQPTAARGRRPQS